MKQFLFILFACLPAFAQDLYVNFEDVAAGTTDSSINMGTVSHTNGTAVSFSWTGSAGKVSVQNGGMNYGLLSPITVGGVAYTNAAFTKHLLCKSDNTVSSQNMFTWTFLASRKVGFGFFITISNYTGLGSFYTVGGIKTGSSYNVLSMVNDDPLGNDDSPYMQNEGLNSPYGENITVQNNMPIWVTGWWDSNNGTANNRSRMYFYNATNWTLLGFSIYPDVTLNETVNTMQWGIQDVHSKDAGTVYRLGALILYTNAAGPVWPGGALQIPTNSSSTAVTAAIAAASNGDRIVLPATNQTWTTGVTLNKNNCVLTSVIPNSTGTNRTKILADGVINALTVSGTLNTVTNFQITGDGINDEATGIVNSGAHNRYSWMLLAELDTGFYAQNSGLLDNSTILNCEHSTRNIFDSSYYDTYNPLALDSTNCFVYEDDIIKWTSGKNTTGPSPYMSSQEGQAFIVRHCYFENNQAGSDPEPVIDYHGDWDPGSAAAYRPGAMLQVYSNVFHFPQDAPSAHGSKFVDVRGGPFTMIYSNQITGGNFASSDGIVYREEHMFDDASPYVLTNAFNFNNTQPNGAVPVNNPLENSGQVFNGREYTNVAPAVLVQLRYPHQMRGIAVADPPGLPFTPGPPKIRGLRLGR